MGIRRAIAGTARMMDAPTHQVAVPSPLVLLRKAAEVAPIDASMLRKAMESASSPWPRKLRIRTGPKARRKKAAGETAGKRT